MMEHLKVSGLYWGLTALSLLDKTNVLDRNEIIDFVVRCQHENGLPFVLSFVFCLFLLL